MSVKTDWSSGAAFLAALAFLLCLFLFKDWLAEPPSAASAAPFDTARAFERISRILGDERPHPVDSAANDSVRERLLGEIRAIGYAPDVRDDFMCRSSVKWRTSACARVRRRSSATLPKNDT